MSALREVYGVTGGCTRKKRNDFGIVIEKTYEFVDLGACEAGVCIYGALIVAEGCAVVAGGAVEKSS